MGRILLHKCIVFNSASWNDHDHLNTVLPTLTLSVPILHKKKINLNFHFRTSLLCLKRFFEAQQRNVKMKNWSQFLFKTAFEMHGARSVKTHIFSNYTSKYSNTLLSCLSNCYVGFGWNLNFKWDFLPPNALQEHQADPTAPIRLVYNFLLVCVLSLVQVMNIFIILAENSFSPGRSILHDDDFHLEYLPLRSKVNCEESNSSWWFLILYERRLWF